MNESYIKKRYNKKTEYWYVNYGYTDNDKKSWYRNNIIKFENGFTVEKLLKKIVKKYKLKNPYDNRVNIKFYHQESEKSYYTWLKYRKSYKKDIKYEVY